MVMPTYDGCVVPFLRLGYSAWDFLGVSFWSSDFFFGGGGGLIFAPIWSSLTLGIRNTGLFEAQNECIINVWGCVEISPKKIPELCS